MGKAKVRWKFTNYETRETYLFEKVGDTIRTVAFLGYMTPSGKLIQRIGVRHG